MAEETTQPIPEETAAQTTAPTQDETASKPAAEKTAAAPRPAARRPRPGPGSRQNRPRRAKVCQFCVEKIDYIDYKKPELLLPYISPYGKMLSRRRTGVCAKHQRRLAVAIKRARFLALLPYTAEHIRRYGS